MNFSDAGSQFVGQEINQADLDVQMEQKMPLIVVQSCLEADFVKQDGYFPFVFGSDPISKARHRDVIIFPQNSESGQRFFNEALKELAENGVKSVRKILVSDKSNGYSAIDMQDLELCGLIEKAIDIDISNRKVVNLRNFGIDRFLKQAEKREFLLDGLFALGSVSLLASMGGVGKSYTLLQIGLAVAGGTVSPLDLVLGKEIKTTGRVVILSAEDDEIEVNERLDRIDKKNFEKRKRIGDNLIILTATEIGGVKHFFKQTMNGIEETEHWAWFCSQMEELRQQGGIAMVAIDPFSAWFDIDINDTAQVYFVLSKFNALARQLGFAGIISHHFSKGKGSGNGASIQTADEARNAVKGSTALVDAVRMVYGMWVLDEQRSIEAATAMNIPFDAKKTPDMFVEGGVLKTNMGSVDRQVRTFQKSEFGLIDLTTHLENKKSDNYKKVNDDLIENIKERAFVNKPFTKTGKSSVYESRDMFCEEIQSMSRQKIENAINNLVAKGKLGWFEVEGKKGQFLDVPDGALSRK